MAASPQAPRPYSAAGSTSSYKQLQQHHHNGGGGGDHQSTSTSPSLSPKSSPLHSSNDTLNSSGSVCSSGNGSSVSACSLQNSSGVSVSSFSSSNGGGGNANNLGLADYLSQLIKDKKQLTPFPKMFYHVERLLDEEISKVRINLFHMTGEKDPLILPEEQGTQVTLTEKVYVPTKTHPDFNFVGRILGPRGLTAKELEKQTGCKIMIRGKGSMRDKNKESQNKGKPNWDHLNDELHVLITVEDTAERARMKLDRAVGEINKLLVPLCEADDELKKRQLMELAILNGTYRDSSPKPQNLVGPVTTQQYYINPSAYLAPGVALAGQIRQLAGNSLILNNQTARQQLQNGASHHALHQQQQQQQQHQPQLFSPSPFTMADAQAAAAAAGFLFSPYDYAAAAATYNPSLAASILNGDYGLEHLTGSVGGATKHKRQTSGREHPYARNANAAAVAAASAATGGAIVQGGIAVVPAPVLFPSSTST
ncbi:Protein held out wings [Hypsibius exemplaris]|uniref:Protein held out wings n=1 Tax=Hypsibius exemplaris TaxID=2072580 RepID=A0A1W0WS78_HYPEX|nr:Protein held out wings [Hypsibius exemplaris]